MVELNVCHVYVGLKNIKGVTIRVTGKFYNRRDLVFLTMKNCMYQYWYQAKMSLEISAYQILAKI